MILDNAYYGHASILARYAGLSAEKPLPGRLQHGWTPGCGISEKLLAQPWAKYLWSQRNFRQAKASGASDIHALGSPYLYLPEREGTPESRGDKSVLVIPFHGWEKEKLRGDMRAYADALKSLEKEGFGPITVCLYWIEYEDVSIRSIFENEGWDVVTNGHRNGNPDFLVRQRETIVRHAYVTSNRVCTAAFYALASGTKFFLYGPSMGLSATQDPSGSEYAAWQAKEFPRLTFEGFGDTLHQDLGFSELGQEYVLPPEALRDLLAWDHGRSLSHLTTRLKMQLWKMRPLRGLLSRSHQPVVD